MTAVTPEPPPKTPEAVQAKRQELSRIQKDLEKTKAELEEYRRQEAGLSRDLHKLESHDAETQHRLVTIQNHIRQAESRRGALMSRLGGLSLASGFWTSVLAGELRDYASCVAGREPSWSGGQLWAEAFRRAVLMEKTRVIASLRGYRLKTEAAVAAARSQTVELKDKGRRAQAEAQSVREEFTRTQAAVTQAHEKVAAAEKRAQELEETKVALAQLLSRLGSARRYDRGGTSAQLDMPKNSLPWPVAGSVARPFGRERNPELNTWVIRQGVTITTRPGAAVGAVGSGQVIYAGPFRSYGKVVILDHGGGFFSIYGELGDILKAKGSAVQAGEAIGTAGGGPGATSPGGPGSSSPRGGDAAKQGVLYLELRRGTQALDPMVWLEKK